MKLIQLCEAKEIISDVVVMTEMELQRYRNSTSRVNNDVYKRLKYLHAGNMWNEETHFVVMANKKIVGVGGVQENPNEKQQLWLKHVSVDPKYEGRGIARKIIEKIYQWAHERNYQVFPSTYSEKGRDSIKSTIDRMGHQYPYNHISNINKPDQYESLNEDISSELFYRGTNSFNKNDAIMDNSWGIHFTRDYNQAKSFGKNVIIAYLDIKNPAPLQIWRDALNRSRGGNPRGMAIEELRQQGYDAVDNPNYETIVFSKNQIHVVDFEIDSSLNELQEPISHYKKILRAKWPYPKTLIEFLERRGYELLGDGAFSDVYGKPGEKFVLKILHRDSAEDCYLKYINAIKNQTNPHFPKIGRIREYKTTNGDVWYLIPVERLQPISREKFYATDECKYAIDFELYEYRVGLEDSVKEYGERVKNKNPQLYSALKFIHSTFRGKCDMDLHRGNMMMRGSTLVLTDPLGYSSNAS